MLATTCVYSREQREEKLSCWVVYHEGEASDGGPGVGKGGAGELELAEVAGEHDRGQGDPVVEEVGQDHGHGEQHLLLGFFHVQHPLPPLESPCDGVIFFFSFSFMTRRLKQRQGMI